MIESDSIQEQDMSYCISYCLKSWFRQKVLNAKALRLVCLFYEQLILFCLIVFCFPSRCLNI